jgi:hypothetical protein
MEQPNYGLLQQSMPQMQPVNQANALLTGMQQGQQFAINNRQINMQEQQAKSQEAYQQASVDKMKQDMSVEQIKLLNSSLAALSNTPPEMRPAAYQRTYTQLQNAGVDLSGVPNTYSPEVDGIINQAYQTSGMATQQLEMDVKRAQINNYQAQAQKALNPELTTGNTVTVQDPNDPSKTIVVPMGQAVNDKMQVVKTGGTTVNVGGENPYKLETGFMLVDPKDPSKGVKAIPGGSQDKQTVEAAGKVAGLIASVPDLQSANSILMENGKPNYAEIAKAQAALGVEGVPWSKGRDARQAMQRVITNKLRVESGAAVPDTEVERYMDMFMPKPWDSPQAIKGKMLALARWQKSVLLRIDKGASAEQKMADLYNNTQAFLQDPNNFADEPDTDAAQQTTGLQVTPEVIAQYRQKYPDKSDEQIKAALELYNQQQQTAEKKSLNNGAPMLGDTVKKYESGNTGAATISSGKGDPGGVSYGTYQLSSNAGTLDRFLKYTGYQKQFQGLQPGTAAFNQRWKELAQNDSQFANAQHAFISETHYKPVVNVAQQSGLPMTPRVAEAIWSMSVQHGKADMLVQRAAAMTQNPNDENEVLKNLYKVRRQYVMNLKNLPYETKKSILARYDSEEKDVLTMAV